MFILYSLVAGLVKTIRKKAKIKIIEEQKPIYNYQIIKIKI